MPRITIQSYVHRCVNYYAKPATNGLALWLGKVIHSNSNFSSCQYIDINRAAVLSKTRSAAQQTHATTLHRASPAQQMPARSSLLPVGLLCCSLLQPCLQHPLVARTAGLQGPGPTCAQDDSYEVPHNAALMLWRGQAMCMPQLRIISCANLCDIHASPICIRVVNATAVFCSCCQLGCACHASACSGIRT